MPPPPPPRPIARSEDARARQRRIEQEEAYYAAQEVHAEYAERVAEARAWHAELVLPPFLPVVYADEVLDAEGTIWAYDAKDRRGTAVHRDLREGKGQWTTLRVRKAEERKVLESGEDAMDVEVDLGEAVDRDEKNIKVLVKNLAERGAVRSMLTIIPSNCSLLTLPRSFSSLCSRSSMAPIHRTKKGTSGVLCSSQQRPRRPPNSKALARHTKRHGGSS